MSLDDHSNNQIGGVQKRITMDEAISLLRFEHHHEGRTGIIAKASRNC